MSKSRFDFEVDDFMSKNQSQPRTIPYEEVSSGGFKPKKKSKGKGFGHFLMKPINWTSSSVKWLTNPTANGGGQYVIKGLAVGCFLLTLENTYQLFSGKEAVKFLPKPMVNDGANIQKPQPFRRADLLVWSDNRFYAALVFTFALNAIEAMILRRVTLKNLKSKLKNNQSTDKEIATAVNSFADQAIDFERLETKVTKGRIQAYGNSRLIISFILLCSCYGFEAWSFFATAPVGTPFLMSTMLAVASIFGSEWLWVLAEHMEDREVDESK